MKKLALFLTSIISVLLPVGLVLSCSGGDVKGPRGGTYTVGSTGNHNYHGNTSNYHLSHPASSHGLSGGVSAAIAIGVAVVVFGGIFLTLEILSRKKKSKKRKRKTTQVNKTVRKVGDDWAGSSKWNHIGKPLKIKSIEELRGYTIGITGVFRDYTKVQIVEILSEWDIDINLRRKTKSTDLWILGIDGTLGSVKVGCIKSTDRIVRSNDISEALSNLRSRKKYIAKTDLKIKENIKATKEPRELFSNTCKSCNRSFNTYIKTRSICRTCKRLSNK